MTVEEDLRETLQRRAACVRPSPDGWAAITVKIDHRRHRARVVVFAMAALLPVVAVGATLAAVRETGSGQHVDTAGSGLAPSPSTTSAQSAAAPEAPTTTAAMRSTTTAPRDVAPVTPAHAHPASIWPETQAELDDAQAAFDEGHQPWRGSAPDVAKAYLLDRGLADPQVTDLGAAGGSSARAVPYVAAGVGGTVAVAQTRDGGIYYVTGSTSDLLTRVDLSRQRSVLALMVETATTATLSARV